MKINKEEQDDDDRRQQAKTEFGLRLRQAREDLELTQKDVASQACVSAEYISRIEKGEKIPADEKLERLAKVLRHAGITFRELIVRARTITDPYFDLYFDGKLPDVTAVRKSRLQRVFDKVEYLQKFGKLTQAEADGLAQKISRDIHSTMKFFEALKINVPTQTSRKHKPQKK